MGFDPGEARDPAGKWTKLANAILKTASNLRDTARVSQEGHTIYTKRAADHLDKAAHQIFAGDNRRAAELLQTAHDTLKKGHPHHRELARIKSHISTHDTLTGGNYYFGRSAQDRELITAGLLRLYGRGT